MIDDHGRPDFSLITVIELDDGNGVEPFVINRSDTPDPDNADFFRYGKSHFEGRMLDGKSDLIVTTKYPDRFGDGPDEFDKVVPKD